MYIFVVVILDHWVPISLQPFMEHFHSVHLQLYTNIKIMTAPPARNWAIELELIMELDLHQRDNVVQHTYAYTTRINTVITAEWS